MQRESSALVHRPGDGRQLKRESTTMNKGPTAVGVLPFCVNTALYSLNTASNAAATGVAVAIALLPLPLPLPTLLSPLLLQPLPTHHSQDNTQHCMNRGGRVLLGRRHAGSNGSITAAILSRMKGWLVRRASVVGCLNVYTVKSIRQHTWLYGSVLSCASRCQKYFFEASEGSLDRVARGQGACMAGVPLLRLCTCRCPLHCSPGFDRQQRRLHCSPHPRGFVLYYSGVSICYTSHLRAAAAGSQEGRRRLGHNAAGHPGPWPAAAGRLRRT
jgi:hypothetical protein